MSAEDATGAARLGLAGRRVAAGAAAGAVAAAAALALDASIAIAAVVALDVAAVLYVTLVWSTLPRSDAEATARRARVEDSSRIAAEAELLAAETASLVAVAFVLGQAGGAAAPARGELIALSTVSVVLAWVSVQTVYMLRYARLYYASPPGGIDFHGEDPDYVDFAYLAFTVGMTFQVSDTTLTAKLIRRVAIHHALLSYVFGTVVVAVAINVVAGLLGHG